jgi:long-chain acyl-CoA synthetase
MTLRSFSLFDLYAWNAAQTPHAPASVWAGGRQTFDQLAADAQALSLGLAEYGLRPGDRVAVLALNSHHFLNLFGAASLLGCVLVLINRRLSTEEITTIVEDTTPRLLVAGEQFQDLAGQLVRNHPFLEKSSIIGSQDHQGLPYLYFSREKAPKPRSAGDEPFAIIHTAAVQGRPRGAVLSEHNLILDSLQLAYGLGLERSDRYLNLLPLFHIMGINLALAVMISGGANVIQEQFDPEKAVQLIRDHNVTLLGTFPPMLNSLLEAVRSSPEPPTSLRKVVGLEQPDTVRAWEEETGSRFWTMYGQTETSGLITYAPYNARAGSAGRAGQLVNLKIVDEFDRELPPGQTGEIVLRGPLVFQGYWQQDELNAHTFREGWHHTGDLGLLDQEGYLFFKGRKAEKDLIKSGGENVFPVEVEKVILQHPGVKEVCVIGIPDPKFGEGIKAVCVQSAEGGLTQQELMAFVGSRIAPYKKPRYVDFVDSLPKSETGEIDRGAVKERYTPEG